MSKVYAIILAAGESKRMSTPKMLLPYKGRTIIEKVIENVVSSDVNETVVVLGAYGDEILKKIGGMPVKHCYNDDYREGMFSSVRCGFMSLPEALDAVLIIPGDFPGIATETLKMLIGTLRRSEKKIIVPLFKGKRGHPLLIRNSLRAEVLKMDPGEGLRGLALKFPDEVLEVEVNDPAVIRDVDTMEDYINELNK